MGTKAPLDAARTPAQEPALRKAQTFDESLTKRMYPAPTLETVAMDRGERTRSRPARAAVLGAVVVLALAAAALRPPDGGAALSATLVPQKGALLGAMAPRVRKFQRLIRHRVAIEHSFYGWEHVFPGTHERWTVGHHRIPMITWKPTGASLAGIVHGNFDPLIRARAVAARTFGKRFFLRFAHEMNGDWYPWSGYNTGKSGARYIAAWRHIHRIFDNVGATKVVWVWSPHWKSFPMEAWNDFRNYYPGDAYVDWVGIDGYNHGSIGHWKWTSFRHLFRNVYNAYAGKKPIMIAETASVEQGGSKRLWIKSARRTMKHRFRGIKAFVWFHFRASYEGHVWDWRVNSSRSALRAFRALADDPYFHPAR